MAAVFGTESSEAAPMRICLPRRFTHDAHAFRRGPVRQLAGEWRFRVLRFGVLRFAVLRFAVLRSAVLRFLDA